MLALTTIAKFLNVTCAVACVTCIAVIQNNIMLLNKVQAPHHQHTLRVYEEEACDNKCKYATHNAR